MAEKCTNTSSPVERWMNPYPFAPLNHFTVPFSLTKNSFRLIANNDSSAACLFALDGPNRNHRTFRYRTRDTRCKAAPQRDSKNFFLALPCAGETAPTET